MVTPIWPIDGVASDGLDGVSNSLSYRVGEIERHLHSNESWFGAATTPNAEIHTADRLASGTSAFVIDAGDEEWGAWVQLLGSSDTPARGTNTKFDLHRFLVVAAERTTARYFLQFAFGTSGAVALSDGTYTECAYYSPAAVSRSAPTVIQSRRYNAGTKVWARCLCISQNTATLTFFIGLHEYEG